MAPFGYSLRHSRPAMRTGAKERDMTQRAEIIASEGRLRGAMLARDELLNRSITG